MLSHNLDQAADVGKSLIHRLNHSLHQEAELAAKFIGRYSKWRQNIGRAKNGAEQHKLEFQDELVFHLTHYF